MRQISFTPRAERDIDEIFEYTADRWGHAQAEDYIGKIRARCAAIASGALVGRGASDIRPGYRRLWVGAHVIFYRAAQDRIEIIRILHARMDFTRHF